MVIISKSTFGDYNQHYTCGSSAWKVNPYPKDFAIVPQELIKSIMDTQGYCDIELNEEGTHITSFTAREIPVIEKDPEDEPVSEAEQLRADLDYLAIMTGVTL